MGWRLLLATLIGEVDMKRILMPLVLIAVSTAIAACGGPSKKEQVPAVEEVRPTAPPPPPATTMPPETTMMRPESMPNRATTPDSTGMQHY